MFTGSDLIVCPKICLKQDEWKDDIEEGPLSNFFLPFPLRIHVSLCFSRNRVFKFTGRTCD